MGFSTVPVISTAAVPAVKSAAAAVKAGPVPAQPAPPQHIATKSVLNDGAVLSSRCRMRCTAVCTGHQDLSQASMR
jgi:hypothetical protein